MRPYRPRFLPGAGGVGTAGAAVPLVLHPATEKLPEVMAQPGVALTPAQPLKGLVNAEQEKVPLTVAPAVPYWRPPSLVISTVQLASGWLPARLQFIQMVPSQRQAFWRTLAGPKLTWLIDAVL